MSDYIYVSDKDRIRAKDKRIAELEAENEKMQADCKDKQQLIERLTAERDELKFELRKQPFGTTMVQTLRRDKERLTAERNAARRCHLEAEEANTRLGAKVMALENAAKLALRVIQSELVNADVPLTSTAIEAELMLRAATEQGERDGEIFSDKELDELDAPLIGEEMTEEITMCPHGRISTGYCEPCEEEKLKACDVCDNTKLYTDSLLTDEGPDCYACLHRKIEMRDRQIASLLETKARQKVALNERDTEIRRMVIAFSTISGIAEGMLDQEKRLGPGMCNMQTAQEDGRRMPDATEEMDDGEQREGVGL